MAKTIQQRVRFRVPPETLFETYVNSRRHSAAIGAPGLRQPEGRGALLRLQRSAPGEEPRDRAEAADRPGLAGLGLEEVRA